MIGFLKRQAVVPFEAAFGFYSVYAGVTSALGFGAANSFIKHELGSPLSLAFSVAYILAGSCLYFGIGLNKRNIEALGLVLIMTSLAVRAIALENLLEWRTEEVIATLVTSYLSSAVFIVACGLRLRFLLARKILVVSESPPRVR